MSFYSRLKRYAIGPSLPTSAASQERLSIPTALAVLSSDALSSVAYATEEILHVLVLAGSGVLGLSLPIALGIIGLLVVVTLSYRQTIRAYPSGGGAYTVARENLGLYPGLLAAAALTIDYILTVTVSIAAGIAALTSAVPSLYPFTVELCLLAIVFIALANLRGLRESGRLFVVPTYVFIVSIFVLILVGLVQGNSPTTIAPNMPVKESLSVFLILRAFAAGCTAMTGVEAISNGVLAFHPPEWKNARSTLLIMSGLLGSMFLGITYLANVRQIVPVDGQTVVSQLGRQIFGNGFFYYFLQIATLLILVLAANTSYADFPRLASLLARDRFLPRQLMLQGDRLVFSNGILLLSLLAAVLIVVFRGNVNAIIPLYAVGVFTSFTLSQAGMVRHWFRTKERGWRTSAVINGLGAIVTTIVFTIIVSTKFVEGAWLVTILIPLVVWIFLTIRRHYHRMSERLQITELNRDRYPLRPQLDTNAHPAVLLVGGVHRGTIEALDYTRSISDEIVAVHIDVNSTDRSMIQQQWQSVEPDIPLIILDSPYRSIVQPLSEFVHNFEIAHPHTFCTIVIPVFVTRHWWENLLHNQTIWFLKSALREKRSRIITTVEYYL
ncbi:APC family permease [Chamaesiphon polymorphus]|uniref:Amino acid permease n=1 Tax=Chamaesiphon polymorphus CCALA 037 TaxID=2107692 RepID=A0A2T1GJX5_9CYAN|nr:APC family permease [Chamaesiphon polymorphus]PSB58126.1 amino acid permease [Chamaesiphon polymorphus CCALA 037]